MRRLTRRSEDAGDTADAALQAPPSPRLRKCSQQRQAPYPFSVCGVQLRENGVRKARDILFTNPAQGGSHFPLHARTGLQIAPVSRYLIPSTVFSAKTMRGKFRSKSS